MLLSSRLAAIVRGYCQLYSDTLHTTEALTVSLLWCLHRTRNVNWMFSLKCESGEGDLRLPQAYVNIISSSLFGIVNTCLA